MSDASEISGQSGAVYLAKNKYTIPTQGKNAVTSTLCYGVQWDAMCRYIGDSHRKTPTKTDVQLTGSVNTDVSKNIYDLAGNCREWTMESCGSAGRHLRGEAFNGSTPISNRYGYGTTGSNVYMSFRLTLYIK